MRHERGNARLRVLDRTVGVALVALLGAARRLRPGAAPADVRRVGFLRTGGIGDAVLLSGVIRDIAATGAEVVLFTGTANAGIGRLVPGAGQVVALPIGNPAAAVRRIRSVPLDVLIDTGSWPRIDAVLAALSGARVTVGFRTAGQHRHHAYDVVVDHSPLVHEIDNFRRLARAAGFESASLPVLTNAEPVPAEVEPSRPFVVFHMHSGGYNGVRKEWPVDRWHRLAAHVVRRGLDVVLTGGPDTVASTAMFRAGLAGHAAGIHDLAGRLSLAQTLGLLEGAAAVVSVNTGVMHMAAAVGASVISLEGPVPTARWGPLGERVTSVVSDHPGAGFLNLGWEYEGAPPDTMLGVDYERVVAAVDAAIVPPVGVPSGSR